MGQEQVVGCRVEEVCLPREEIKLYSTDTKHKGACDNGSASDFPSGPNKFLFFFPLAWKDYFNILPAHSALCPSQFQFYFCHLQSKEAQWRGFHSLFWFPVLGLNLDFTPWSLSYCLQASRAISLALSSIHVTNNLSVPCVLGTMHKLSRTLDFIPRKCIQLKGQVRAFILVHSTIYFFLWHACMKKSLNPLRAGVG